jgi:predicted regulator of Ras-like GTPase activity (Roadblock/LC7/MglB family)
MWRPNDEDVTMRDSTHDASQGSAAGAAGPGAARYGDGPATTENGAYDPAAQRSAGQPGVEEELARKVQYELAELRQRVAGLQTCVIAGVDGLLVLHASQTGPEPHDLAALSAAMFGIGRQAGHALGHGGFRESIVHSDHGYFAVYAVGEFALLAVAGDEHMNLGRLHLEARATGVRLAELIDIKAAGDVPRQQAPGVSVGRAAVKPQRSVPRPSAPSGG